MFIFAPVVVPGADAGVGLPRFIADFGAVAALDFGDIASTRLALRFDIADGVELAGQTKTPPQAHMQNFFESVRGNATPNCPFEVGFRVSIACRMAVDSYRQGRTLTWDPAREEIIPS